MAIQPSSINRSTNLASGTVHTAITPEPNGLRPQSLDEYVGQEKLKQILRVSVGAAINRGDRTNIGHILLYGPPGLGKTSCALLMAKLLGTRAHIITAPALEKPKDIVGTLLSLQEGEVLFIDEIHRLNRVTEEILYPVLEDFALDLATGKGPTARVSRIALPKFVMVGATTKLGQISAPLRSRFTHLHRMEFYTLKELTEIAKRSAKVYEVQIDECAALAIAERARGTPRTAIKLCRMVADYAMHKGLRVVDAELVQESFNLFQIDDLGLDVVDLAILNTLTGIYAGRSVGLETIAVTVGEDAQTIEDHYEPYLLKCGLIERTARGRRATSRAYRHLNIEAPKESLDAQIALLD